MKLVLQEDVSNLGNAGDVVSVKDGYGRNFLLPKKLAVVANPKNIKEMEHQKKVIAVKQAKIKKEIENNVSKLSGVVLTIEREAGEEDKLFGSVTSRDVAESLHNHGFVVDRHNIKIDDSIKALGEYDVEIKFPMQVTGKVKVKVVKK